MTKYEEKDKLSIILTLIKKKIKVFNNIFE